MDIEIESFATVDFSERIRIASRVHGQRLWSSRLATVWDDVIGRLPEDAGTCLSTKLRRELIALAPESAAAERAYRALMDDGGRSFGEKPRIVHLILSSRKYASKALSLHSQLSRFLDPVFIVVGDPTLSDPVFDGPLLIVPVPDNYESLTPKVLEALVAVRRRFGAAGILKIDDDSWIGTPDLLAVPKLVRSSQYAGRVVGDPDFDRCRHIGKCESNPDELYRGRFRGRFVRGPLYYLGPDAVDLLVREYLFFRDEFEGEIFEDKAIGDTLRRLGVTPTDLDLSAVFGIYNMTEAPVDEAQSAYWSSRHTYWEGFFAAKQDPWQYDNIYEVTKYEQTLSLLPDGPIERALEVACAEGHFTVRLAPRVGTLFATDISPTALRRTAERCEAFGNVRALIMDLSSDTLPGGVDLLVCSEVLYYLPKQRLPALAAKFAAALRLGGHLLVAHAAMAVDDRSRTGFDWGHSFGVRTIAEVFTACPALRLVREVHNDLYRIQLYQRVDPASRATVPEPDIREIPFAAPLPLYLERSLIRGGAVRTRAEAALSEEAVEVPILMYHAISDDGPSELAPYRVSPAAFGSQMRHLRRHGYHTISLQQWADAVSERKPLRGRPLIITFDDGYADFMTHAAPILEAADFSATVFVVTGKVGQAADWDATSRDPLPLMGWDDLRDLHRRGFGIASHTASHQDLTLLSDEDIVREGLSSRASLEEHLGAGPPGVSPQCIAFPWGRSDNRIRSALRRAGYTIGVTAEGGRSTFADDTIQLPRIEIFGHDDMTTFVHRLSTPGQKPEPGRQGGAAARSDGRAKGEEDVMTQAQLRLFAGRIEPLIEALTSLRSDMLTIAAPEQSAQQRIAALFNLPPTGGVAQTPEPYEPLVPGVHFGFDAAATVSVNVRPKQNHFVSPETYLNTLDISFSGTSRWLTLETGCSWPELASATRYQINVCAELDASMTCRPLLRMPLKDGSVLDCTLSPMTLGPDRRAGVSSGELLIDDISAADINQKPHLLLFFDTKNPFSMRLEYVNIYFS